jgi:hypothetical protein
MSKFVLSFAVAMAFVVGFSSFAPSGGSSPGAAQAAWVLVAEFGEASMNMVQAKAMAERCNPMYTNAGNELRTFAQPLPSGYWYCYQYEWVPDQPNPGNTGGGPSLLGVDGDE